LGEFVRSKSFRRIISICFFTTLLLSIFSLLSASALALTGASVSTDVQLTEIMDGKTGTCVSSGDQKVDCAFDIYGGNMNHSPGSVWSSKVSMKNTGKSDGVFNLTPSVCSETVDGNSADPVSADTLCNYMNIAIVQNGTPLWSGTATELGSVGVLNLTPLNISASSDFVFNLSVAPNVPDGIQGSSISQPLVWSLTAAYILANMAPPLHKTAATKLLNHADIQRKAIGRRVLIWLPDVITVHNLERVNREHA